MQTRREFVLTLGALGASTLFTRRAARAFFQATKFNFDHKSLAAGRGIVIGNLPSGGNVLLINSETGPIVIDSKFAHTASDLLADLQAHAGEKPGLLISTHHHFDHSGGAWLFNESSIKTIAHKNFKPRLGANMARYVDGAQERLNELKEGSADASKVGAAQETVTKLKSLKPENFAPTNELPDGVSLISHGGVEIQTYHYGNGHTDNDLVVYFPEPNVMHMGDLVFHNLHPYIDRSAKADTRGWQNSVRQAMKLGDNETIIIPGHGEVTDKTALSKQIEYFDQIREVVEAGIKDGKSREAIAALKPDAFKGRGFEQFQGMALGAVYDEIAAKTS